MYQVFFAFSYDNRFNNYNSFNEFNCFEGFTDASFSAYNMTDISSNNPLILQNINNINYLNNEFIDMSGNISKMQQQINGLVQQQNQYANNMTGGTPPNITGATDDSSTTSGTT
jgi:hypothetical protein